MAATAAAAPPAVPPAVAWEAFVTGARIVFSRWTVLQLASNGAWGGPFTDDKISGMLEDVLYLFHENAQLYPDDVEHFLLESLSGSLNCVAEDDSAREVALLLCRLADECKRGEFSRVYALQAKAQSAPRAAEHSRAAPGSVDDDDDDDDDDDEDVGEDAFGGEAVAPGVAHGAAAAAAAPPPTQKQSMEDVDDGWTVVHRNRRH